MFTTQLEKSREATDQANVRSAYAQVMAEYLSNGATGTPSASVTARQTQDGWQNTENGTLIVRVNGTESGVSVLAKTNGDTWTITIDPDEATLITVN